MVRIDFQSVIVLGVALMASFGTALTIRHLEGDGAAQAATAPVPVTAPAAVGTAAQVVKADDGHYWAQARIDGRAVRVLVDTGASVVVLTRADAGRLGVAPEPASFTGRIQTASGMVTPCSITTVGVCPLAHIKALNGVTCTSNTAGSLTGCGISVG